MKHFVKNREKFDELLVFIENKYEKEIQEMSVRIVFVDCEFDNGLPEPYICDKSVVSKMKKIKVREICVEKSVIYFYIYNDWGFIRPAVRYQYEYDGTTESGETVTYYYQPIDEHWSLLIDSSFP
jgi:hypothetical protein